VTDSIGKRFRALRKHFRLTQAEVAEQFGGTKAKVSKIEKDQQPLTSNDLQKLKWEQVNLNWLFWNQGEQFIDDFQKSWETVAEPQAQWNRGILLEELYNALTSIQLGAIRGKNTNDKLTRQKCFDQNISITARMFRLVSLMQLEQKLDWLLILLEPYDIRQTLEELVQSVQPLLHARSQTASIHGKGIAIYDDNLLQHILRSLLGMASEHAGNGKPLKFRITQEADRNHILLSYTPMQSTIEFTNQFRIQKEYQILKKLVEVNRGILQHQLNTETASFQLALFV